MKFLVVGDLHIKNDNFEEIDIVFSEIQKTAESEKIDNIILLGDILHWHEKIFTQSLNRALDFIKKCSDIAHTYVLVGNHDLISNQQFLTENHWMNVLKTSSCKNNVTIVDTVLDEGSYLLCPYVFPGRFIEALETHPLKDWRNKKVIFAHQEFRSCQMGNIKSDAGDCWDNDFPLVVSGHIHDNQKIGKSIYYPGAPLQHNSWDSDKRVICTVELSLEDDEETPKIVEFPLDVPKKHVIRTDLKNLSEVGPTNSSDKIKIKLSATAEEFKVFKETQEYKKLIDKGIKIQHVSIDLPHHHKIEERGEVNFRKILETLIDDEEDLLVKYLYSELFTS